MKRQKFRLLDQHRKSRFEATLRRAVWRPDPDAKVLSYEERVAAHEKQIADENEQRREMYAERAANQAQREMENQRRAIAEAQQRRDIENFGEATQG